ncbi:thiol:disulfide interchange protein DsbA/DsbL [Caenimonas koreensis]|uniref:Thiol:disulfide interchange protein n=1 Tax=Caenimonas koreensis DSM 17982 TaxID=1121255 RepID=A0A844ATE4_9BURK|nr:thiol:disulfide interchange protein DsbA/DsbL [Caenimonas koreensis]MRD47374.1 thioredoxin domain-containing protein [Caenimonas koreensis DSM 17982]
MIDRRKFSGLALVAIASLPHARAQINVPVEGTHFLEMSPRQPTRDRAQVEVVEFFAYSCVHCHAFEPALDAWQKALPAGILFRRIPVAFNDGAQVLHQRLYFALESLGLLERLHRRVFAAIHVQHDHLHSAPEIAAFLARNGVDAEQVMQVMNSFGVTSRLKPAMQLAGGYGIEGTPSLGIDGRWLTSGSMAGSNQRSLQVADYLLSLAMKKR